MLQCECTSLGGYPAPTLGWYRDHTPFIGPTLTKRLKMVEHYPLNGTLYSCKADQENIVVPPELIIWIFKFISFFLNVKQNNRN